MGYRPTRDVETGLVTLDGDGSSDEDDTCTHESSFLLDPQPYTDDDWS